MDKNTMTYLVIGLVIGFIIAIVFMSIVSPRSRKYTKVKKELEQTKDELNTQKQMIAKHFSNSAEILDSMAKDFRRLYQHMAENSSQFLANEEISAIDLNIDNNQSNNKEITLNKQPKDYSDDPSGLFKTDENKS